MPTSMHDDIRVVVQQALRYSRNQVHFNSLLQEEINRSRHFLGSAPVPVASSSSSPSKAGAKSSGAARRVASASPRAASGSRSKPQHNATVTKTTKVATRRSSSSSKSPARPGPSVERVTVKVRDVVAHHDSDGARRHRSRSRSTVECRICGCNVAETSSHHRSCVRPEAAGVPASDALRPRSRSRRSTAESKHHDPEDTHYVTSDRAVGTSAAAMSTSRRSAATLREEFDRLAEQTLASGHRTSSLDLLVSLPPRSLRAHAAAKSTVADTQAHDDAIARIDAHIMGIKATLDTVAQGLQAVTSTVDRVVALGPPAAASAVPSTTATRTSPPMRSGSRRPSVTFDANFVFPTDHSPQQSITGGHPTEALASALAAADQHLVRPRPLDGRNATGDENEILQQWHNANANIGDEPSGMHPLDVNAQHTPQSEIQRGSSLEPSSPSSHIADNSAKNSLREPLGVPPALAMSFDAGPQQPDDTSPLREEALRGSADLLSPTDFVANRQAAGSAAADDASPSGNFSMSDRGSSALTPTSEKIYASKRRLSKALKPISAPSSVGAVLGRDKAFESLASGSRSAPESPPQPAQSSPPAAPPLVLVDGRSPRSAARAPTVPPERGEGNVMPPHQSSSLLIDLQTDTAPPSPSPGPNILQPPRPASPPGGADDEIGALHNGSFPSKSGLDTAAPSPSATPRPDDLHPSQAPSPLTLASTSRGPQQSQLSSFRAVETGPISSPTTTSSAVARGRYQKVLQHKRSDSLASIDDATPYSPSPPLQQQMSSANVQTGGTDEGVQATTATVSESTGTASSPLMPPPPPLPTTTTPLAPTATTAAAAAGVDVNALVLTLVQGMMQQQQQLIALQQQQQLNASLQATSGAAVAPDASSRRTSTSSPSPVPPATTAAYLQALAAAREALLPYRSSVDEPPAHREDQPPVPMPRQPSDSVTTTRVVRPGRPPAAPSTVVVRRRTSSASAATDKTVATAAKAPVVKRGPLPRSYAQTFAQSQAKVIYLGALDRPTCSSLAHSSLRYRVEHALAPEDAHCPDCYAVNSRRDSVDPSEEAAHSRLFPVPPVLRLHDLSSHPH